MTRARIIAYTYLQARAAATQLNIRDFVWIGSEWDARELIEPESECVIVSAPFYNHNSTQASFMDAISCIVSSRRLTVKKVRLK
jgi:hypothetical protein